MRESTVLGIGQDRYVEATAGHGSFSITGHGSTASLYLDPNDYSGVVNSRPFRFGIERILRILYCIRRPRWDVQ